MQYDSLLSPADAAVFETFVVPRYLGWFGELASELLLTGDSPRVLQLGCRTGYFDALLLERGGGSVVGTDASPAALELARSKATALGAHASEYILREGDVAVPQLTEASFSNVVCLHPIATQKERLALCSEAHHWLYEGGQCLMALPLRGSFAELRDLLREYALKFDDGVLAKAVEEMILSRPTIETLTEELEAVGLDDVDVEIRTTTIPFDSGRAFIEDPVTRLMILPEVRASLERSDLDAPIQYLRDAIDKYWSELRFELSVNVGCASARKW